MNNGFIEKLRKSKSMLIAKKNTVCILLYLIIIGSHKNKLEID